MKITKLQLENFRNYSKHAHEFDLSAPLTILVGLNGKGKTNFLEAIYLLSLGRSFRTPHTEELIEWEKDYFRCTAEIEVDNEKSSLEVFYSHRPRLQKNYKKNEVNLKNSEYIGNLLTVLFHPEDLNMLYLSPSYRRKYMDILLSQTDKKYLDALTQYKKLLKQRNALLHQIRKHELNGKNTTSLQDDLTAWDEQLVKFGTILIEKRKKLVKYLNSTIQDLYQSISGNNEKVKIDYKYSVMDNYMEELQLSRKRDIFSAKSHVGPHLDDLKFYLNGTKISASASRGEFRTLLLAMKLAEIQFIKEKTQHQPILLLDDIFSELDPDRSQHLLSILKNHQTIITTTDITNLHEISKNATLVEV